MILEGFSPMNKDVFPQLFTAGWQPLDTAARAEHRMEQPGPSGGWGLWTEKGLGRGVSLNRAGQQQGHSTKT